MPTRVSRPQTAYLGCGILRNRQRASSSWPRNVIVTSPYPFSSTKPDSSNLSIRFLRAGVGVSGLPLRRFKIRQSTLSRLATGRDTFTYPLQNSTQLSHTRTYSQLLNTDSPCQGIIQRSGNKFCCFSPPGSGDKLWITSISLPLCQRPELFHVMTERCSIGSHEFGNFL